MGYRHAIGALPYPLEYQNNCLPPPTPPPHTHTSSPLELNPKYSREHFQGLALWLPEKHFYIVTTTLIHQETFPRASCIVATRKHFQWVIVVTILSTLQQLVLTSSLKAHTASFSSGLRNCKGPVEKPTTKSRWSMLLVMMLKS